MGSYFTMRLAASTLRTYSSGKTRFLKFCEQTETRALPVCENILCCFCAHLANGGLKHRTIKVYLSAVGHMQIAAGQQDPLGSGAAPMPRLEYVMRGIKRKEVSQHDGTDGRERLPITPSLLLRIKASLENGTEFRDREMIWAACCICFFAFLRVGEMTVPTDGGFDPSVHLGVGDVALDNPREPSTVQVRIKQSKTDPFHRGINLYVGRTGSSLCPVLALLGYLQMRGMDPGPLFRYRDRRALTRSKFAAAVRLVLKKAGVDQAKYCTHSFRIGAATTAAANGIEDSVIKTMGRWESLAYLQYVRIPRERLSGYSKQLMARCRMA